MSNILLGWNAINEFPQQGHKTKTVNAGEVKPNIHRTLHKGFTSRLSNLGEYADYYVLHAVHLQMCICKAKT